MWMGGFVPMGYRSNDRTLIIDEAQAEHIRTIFARYLDLGNVRDLKRELDGQNWTTPVGEGKDKRATGGRLFSRGHLYRILTNPIYRGMISHKGAIYPGQHPAIIDQELWDHVQAKLADNRQGSRMRTGGKALSLLGGLVFDQQGQRLTPTHACKGSRRYRYYVSRGLIGKAKAGTNDAEAMGLRIPAQELEDLVRKALASYLNDPQKILADMDDPDAGTYQAILRQAKQMAETLLRGSVQEQLAACAVLIERVMVSKDQMMVVVKRSALSGDSQLEGAIAVTVPVQFRRCGFGIRLIVPGQTKQGSGSPDERLVTFVRRGAAWFRRMVTKAEGPSVIAQAEGVSASLVQRIIYVAFLAPDIVEAIETGRQPATLTSDGLLRALPLPACWNEQRRVLGFTSAGA
jgi:hypothetical protein